METLMLTEALLTHLNKRQLMVGGFVGGFCLFGFVSV